MLSITYMETRHLEYHRSEEKFSDKGEAMNGTYIVDSTQCYYFYSYFMRLTQFVIVDLLLLGLILGGGQRERHATWCGVVWLRFGYNVDKVVNGEYLKGHCGIE